MQIEIEALQKQRMGKLVRRISKSKVYLIK
jgi:hypothetical protein